ncbi:MAG: hypothetical protein H7Z37_09700 [Pyrinomonadaceae bacterium]|nr:hypothetical protein [Pyrinomonadaceae bacterium]
MHDCQKSQIQELLLDEFDDAQKQRFFNELRDCPNCQNELAAMSKVFDDYEKFSRLDEPSEIYWQSFEANLQRQISTFAPPKNFAKRTAKPNVWDKIKTAFATSIKVPLPIAAAILLIFATLAIFALRPQTQQTQIVEIATPQIVEKSAPQIITTTIEKPVIQEKIVLREKIIERKVYVPRRETNAKTQPKTTLEARKAVDEEKIPTLNLAEFKPATKQGLKIIRTNSNDEIK